MSSRMNPNSNVVVVDTKDSKENIDDVLQERGFDITSIAIKVKSLLSDSEYKTKSSYQNNE